MKEVKKVEIKPNFVKIEVKDNATSIMECGGTHMCNEARK
jgi:hypothetical protein